jgi:ATP-binding cassette subfamily B protein
MASEEVFNNMALVPYSGKSSLLRLLYRFYDVTGGEILIDGQNIRNLTQQSLRAALGIVPQEPVLWNDTIGESLCRQKYLALLTRNVTEQNIGYGREGSTDEEIREAAKAARLDERIMGFPEGESTPT